MRETHTASMTNNRREEASQHAGRLVKFVVVSFFVRFLRRRCLSCRLAVLLVRIFQALGEQLHTGVEIKDRSYRLRVSGCVQQLMRCALCMCPRTAAAQYQQ